MKDLYSTLGIDSAASEREVAAALASRPELAAYSTILLQGERRAAYDRAHAALKAIGGLRQRLGLDTDSSWFVDNCPDFVLRQHSAAMADKRAAPAGATAARQEPLEDARPLATPAPVPARSVRPVIATLAILAIAAALAIAVFIFR